MQFHVEDMSCGHCVKSITEAVKAADPAAVVNADLDKHQVEVSSSLPRAAIEKVLEEAGYPASAA